jgi:hypothetical protein
MNIVNLLSAKWETISDGGKVFLVLGIVAMLAFFAIALWGILFKRNNK